MKGFPFKPFWSFTIVLALMGAATAQAATVIHDTT